MGRKRTRGEFRPVSNPAMAEGMRQLRSSGAAGFHLDKRERRRRGRNDARRAAIRDQRGNGW